MFQLELEKALILGEHTSKENEAMMLEMKKEKLIKCAQKLDEKMKDCQLKQEQDQKDCKGKLHQAQETFNKIEKALTRVNKNSEEYNEVFEQFLEAQEILDNERKNFEDLEFHHLEEEANWLASREEIQREIVDLSQKIEDYQNALTDLDQQDILTSCNNLDEFRKIEQQRSEYANQIERIKEELKNIDSELLSCSVQESEQEVSSDSDSDKLKDEFKEEKNDLMSQSMFETRQKVIVDDLFNMSQSFNEKMLHEKSILEDGIGT